MRQRRMPSPSGRLPERVARFYASAAREAVASYDRSPTSSGDHRCFPSSAAASSAKIMLGVLGLALSRSSSPASAPAASAGSASSPAAGGRSAWPRVGGEKVTADRGPRQVSRALRSAIRQQQPELDMATFLRRGALERAARPADRRQTAARLRPAAGPRSCPTMVDSEIANIPAFQELTGQFDQNAFRAALARNKMTEAAAARRDLARSLQRAAVCSRSPDAPRAARPSPAIMPRFCSSRAGH